MAIVTTDNKHYQDIASQIRACKGSEETILPSEMASKVGEVYDSGKQRERDDFWDVYQENGNRTNYGHAFRSVGWTIVNFKPKYDLILSGSHDSMFYQSRIEGDLAEILEEQGVTLDTSQVTYTVYFMASTRFTRVPKIDLTGMGSSAINQLFFYSAYLETIDELVVTENTNFTTYAFTGCSALKNIKITGTIGKSIYFSQSSTLDIDDVKTIITTNLKNYKDTENEGVYTFKLHANVWKALNASGTAPNGETWENYVSMDLGWAI